MLLSSNFINCTRPHQLCWTFKCLGEGLPYKRERVLVVSVLGAKKHLWYLLGWSAAKLPQREPYHVISLFIQLILIFSLHCQWLLPISGYYTTCNIKITFQCKIIIVPEECWFGQPKYSTHKKDPSTLCRLLPLFSSKNYDGRYLKIN